MIQVIHFHNGTGGGVLSVIRNLLMYSQNNNIENHVVYTINRDHFDSFEIFNLQGATSEKIFYYSSKWNFYYTCKQLSKYLPNDNAIIVAHDWLEMGMVSNLGLRNRVIQVLHGDFNYYFNLAKVHTENVDLFVCVSGVISKKLKLIIDSTRKNIIYLRFPVPEVPSGIKDFSKFKCAFFVRNLNDERKQAFLLPRIAMKLTEMDVCIEWHIAGGGMSLDDFKLFWGLENFDNVKFYGKLNNNQINSMLKLCNAMILPSVSEGFPVALVEAMKNGLVPLISYWDGAVSDLVIDGYNGYYFEINDSESYADTIKYLSLNPDKHLELSKHATEESNKLYDPFVNTECWENIYIKVSQLSLAKKSKFKSYGSMLDKEYLPNFVTYNLRKIKSIIAC